MEQKVDCSSRRREKCHHVEKSNVFESWISKNFVVRKSTARSV